MKKFSREIIFGILVLLSSIGLIYWFTTHEPDASLKILLATILTLGGLGIYLYNAWKKKRDIDNEVPVEDEMILKAKTYAGNKSFHLSFYLWGLIFIFHGSFSEPEEMLGVGILGSALIYGCCLWYFKTTQNFNDSNL